MSSAASRRSRAGFVLLFGACLLLQAWRLLLTPYGLTSTWSRTSDVSVVSTAGRGLAQEFTMGADGLDGLWVWPAPAHDPGEPPDAARRPPWTGQVVVALYDGTLDARSPLLRQVVAATAFDTTRPVHLAFPEVRGSRGRRFVVTLTHVGQGDAGAVHLRARRVDALVGARFTADDTEQWGDLLFETSAQRATLPYWRDEILAPWPAWMRSWAVILLVLVAANVLLALACRRVTIPVARRAPARPVAGVPHRAALLVTCALVASGLLVVLWPTPPVRVVSLADHLPDAHIETSRPWLHEAVEVQGVGIAGRPYRAIVALPTTRLAWTVQVPRGALLVGGVAMRPDIWHKEGDGANLVVAVEVGAERTEVARYTLVPFLVAEHRQQHPLRVPLEPWAGQSVTLVFETDPERWGNAVNDVPMWVNPRIEWPRGGRWGEVHIIPHAP